MLAQIPTLDALEALAIILSVVSLIISVVAFFASLKFYRDGVQLQQAANDALTQISEKTAFIQTQVGGMFDKTLDAAIGKREILATQFEEVNQQLEKTKAKLIEESIGQIGAAGEQERKRLAEIVDVQMKAIREKVETTRESAQEIVESEFRPSVMWGMINLLNYHHDGLTAAEVLANMTGRFPYIEFNLEGINYQLKELQKRGIVYTHEDKYFSLKKIL